MMSSQIALLLVASLLCASTVSGQSSTVSGTITANIYMEDATNTAAKITYATPAPATLTCGATVPAGVNIAFTLPAAAAITSITVTNLATLQQATPTGGSAPAPVTTATNNAASITVKLTGGAAAADCASSTTATTPFSTSTNVATWNCPAGATATTVTFAVAASPGFYLCNVQIFVVDPPTTPTTTTTTTTTTAKATVKAALVARLDWTVLLVALAASIGTQKV